MRLPVISFIALILFLFVQHFPLAEGKMISRETTIKNIRYTFHVEQATSTDGLITIKKSTIDFSNVGQRMKTANHNRMLRAFISTPDASDMVILESVRPHEFFVLKGPFVVMNNTSDLHWVGPTTLSIVSNTVIDGAMEYVVDVHTLQYSKHATSSTQQIKTSAGADKLLD
jgi:hypothetical protein